MVFWLGDCGVFWGEIQWFALVKNVPDICRNQSSTPQLMLLMTAFHLTETDGFTRETGLKLKFVKFTNPFVGHPEVECQS